MQREFLKSKIHRATITEANLHYEGSLTIDEDLMDEARIMAYERIYIYNINNGARFDTYAIPGGRGSGVIGLNGAAARLGHIGDLIIIVSYCSLSEEEIKNFKPRLLLMDEKNRLKEIIEV